MSRDEIEELDSNIGMYKSSGLLDLERELNVAATPISHATVAM